MKIYTMFESIILSKIMHAPIDAVWAVITETNHLKNWYFDFSEDFRLEIGHTWEWWAGPPNGKKWLHRGVVTQLIHGKRFVHTWEYPGYIGKGEVVWVLTAINDNQTKVDFAFNFLTPFDPTEEALSRENFELGWNYILMNGLEEYLSKLI